MTDLILWRHGQTDYNTAGRIQGQVDIPLNETGVAQARGAAPALAALKPSRIVSSPLSRAQETAEALAELVGLSVQTHEALMERSFGLWEGLTRSQMEEGWPAEFELWRQGRDPEGIGVETRRDCAARVGGAMASIAREMGAGDSGPIVVVAHGAAITLGASWMLKLDPSAWFGLRGLDNCHFARLRSCGREPGWMLVSWNEPGSLVAELAHPVMAPRAW